MSGDERQILARRLIALAELRRRVKLADDEARLRLASLMSVESREAVRLPTAYGDDVKVGAVTYAKGARSAGVTDERSLLAWVKDRDPDAIETVTIERVKPWFEEELLRTARARGVAVTDDGEEIPGVTVRDGAPVVKVLQEKTDEAVGVLLDAIYRDQYALRSLLELPAGGSDDV